MEGLTDVKYSREALLATFWISVAELIDNISGRKAPSSNIHKLSISATQFVNSIIVLVNSSSALTCSMNNGYRANMFQPNMRLGHVSTALCFAHKRRDEWSYHVQNAVWLYDFI